jgi:CubicO group peptidase (beta-lactamase class C family)
VAKLTVKNNKVIDPVQYRSFSDIYASGQTVSTSEDMFRFISALVQHRLVPKELLVQMMDLKRLRMGVGYGYGLMKVRIHPLTSRYDVWGHLGSLGSFMLYNPGMDAYVIGSFNKAGYFGQSIRFVAQVLRILAKVEL